MASYQTHLTNKLNSGLYTTTLKSAQIREERTTPTPIKSYADFTEKYLTSAKSKHQAVDYSSRVANTILGTGLAVKSISTKDLNTVTSYTQPVSGTYQPHSLYLRENRLGLSKSKDMGTSKPVVQDSNHQFFNHSWTRVKVEHFQDQQRKLIDKIQEELKKRGISDHDLGNDIKRKGMHDQIRAQKSKEKADLNRLIEDLESQNKERGFKVDRLVNEIDTLERSLWNE